MKIRSKYINNLSYKDLFNYYKKNKDCYFNVRNLDIYYYCYDIDDKEYEISEKDKKNLIDYSIERIFNSV